MPRGTSAATFFFFLTSFDAAKRGLFLLLLFWWSLQGHGFVAANLPPIFAVLFKTKFVDAKGMFAAANLCLQLQTCTLQGQNLEAATLVLNCGRYRQ